LIEKQRLGIIGCGGLGMMAIQIAKKVFGKYVEVYVYMNKT